MQQHSVLLKVSNVFDQYIHYKLIPEKGYKYDFIATYVLAIHYTFVEHSQTSLSYEVYQEKKNQLLDYIRKAAKALIALDVYTKITIRQSCENGVEDIVEEIF